MSTSNWCSLYSFSVVLSQFMSNSTKKVLDFRLFLYSSLLQLLVTHQMTAYHVPLVSLLTFQEPINTQRNKATLFTTTMATPNPRQTNIHLYRQASSKSITTSTNKYTLQLPPDIYLYLPIPLPITTTAALKYLFFSTLLQADKNKSTLSILRSTKLLADICGDKCTG